MITIKNARDIMHKPQARFMKITHPLSERFTYLIVNYTKISANFVSWLALVITIICAICFLKGYYLIGILLFYIRATLDNTDGRVARLRKQESKFGALLDNITGYFGVGLCSIALIINYNTTILIFLIPLIIMMAFVQPLKATILMLFLKKVPKRDWLEWLSQEDLRIISFMILPLLPYLITIENLTLIPMIIISLVSLTIIQFFWFKYYQRSFEMFYEDFRVIH